MSGTRIDFRRLADRALQSLESLLVRWLPNGHREGFEYKALNPTRADSKIGSFSINLNTGAWSDFATGDKGGDAISLYAYLNNVSQLEAARALVDDLGAKDALITDPVAASTAVVPDKRRTEWVPIVPAPHDAGEYPKAHIKRGRPERQWPYYGTSGELLGVIYRFRTSDGGKEILPCVFAEHAETKAREWRWMQFPAPRPLYGLHSLDDRPVLLVEGEKCADAAAEALTADGQLPPLHSMAWPGGAKAVDKVDWSPLAGKSVLLWPDCDAQRAKPSQAKRLEIGDDEILPEAEQPGAMAMERIAELLLALSPPAKVRIIAIPKPGEKPSGWDIADAIAEGWTREQLLAFMREHQRDTACSPKVAATQRGAAAEDDDDRPKWKRELLRTDDGIKDCRENVIYVLRDHPEWEGVLGADEFAKRIVVRKPSPLGHQPGVEWKQDDDIDLGLWLAERRPRILIRSIDTLRAAVQFVAKQHTFHPVREFFAGFHWDNQNRIDTWTHVYLGAEDTPYTRLVGRFFLVNMVRRIYQPGCIMRSVPVLEGPQDKGKSTALRTLAAPWFSDTPFKVGDKDSYQQIQGVMLYEISELESFTRAEATAVKAFVSSTEDNFRAPYERQNEKHARQTVFAATTNAQEYLKDWTGNTRFWPLPCGATIRIDELAAVREQLLAEAVVLYQQGARTYPTAEQQETLFKPEQDKRLMLHPWMELIEEGLGNFDYRSKNQVSVKDVLVDICKVDLARVNPQGGEAQIVGKVLHALGWSKARLRSDSRAWVWQRPAPKVVEEEDSSGIPF